MTDENKEKFKPLLLKEKEALEEKLAELTDVDFGTDIDSGEEESDETEEISTNVSLEEGFRGRLEDIDAALEKIESGAYGVCENCGEDIEMDLLEANPESRLCRACKDNG